MLSKHFNDKTQEIFKEIAHRINNPVLTEDIADIIINNQTQLGGKRIVGTRKMIIVSELSGGSEELKEDLNEIEEIIKKQTQDMFNNVVKKFMELKNVDESQAIKLKDELYQKVSNEHPELNDYDRADLMQKLVNDKKELSRLRKKSRH